MKTYIAVDIEFTGKGVNDKVFAIGFAWGNFEDGNGELIGEVRRELICLDLGKPEDVTWEDYWHQQNWELGCYYEFWRDNLDILNSLQTSPQSELREYTTVCLSDCNITYTTSEKTFVEEINSILANIECTFDETIIVSDTLLVDTYKVSELLNKYGFKALWETRKGVYRKGIMVTNYLQGMFKGPEAKKKVSAFRKSSKYKLFDTVYDHNPANDAKTILHTLFRAFKKNSKKKMCPLRKLLKL